MLQIGTVQGFFPHKEVLLYSLGGAKNKTSEEKWSCEEVFKWAITIKVMTDDVGTFLVSIGDNGSILLDM